jgi:membrane fusion protein (multidrug efflux system)
MKGRAFLLLAALVAISCGGGEQEDRSAVPVVAAHPKVESVDLTVEVLGEVHGWREADLSFNASGRISFLRYDLGDRVNVGAVMATLELDQPRASLAQAEAILEKAILDSTRISGLFAQGIASQAEYEDVSNAVKQARASVAMARQMLSSSRIVAPFSGVVGSRSGEVGEVISPGMSGPTYRLVQSDRLKITAGIPEGEAAPVRVGQGATVTAGAVPDTFLSGTVYAMSDIVDPISRTVEVQVELDNGAGLLRPGGFVRLRIVTGTMENAVVVPDGVLERSLGRITAWVVKDSIARPVQVQLGPRSGDDVVITDGLSPEDLLIVRGQFGLRDGSEVEVIEASLDTLVLARAEETQ